MASLAREPKAQMVGVGCCWKNWVREREREGRGGGENTHGMKVKDGEVEEGLDEGEMRGDGNWGCSEGRGMEMRMLTC